MHVLFVHPNFPAQFRYLAPRLARDYGWRCTFVTRNAKAPDVPGVERVLYRRAGGESPANHPCTRYFERAVRDAHGVYEAMKARPDVKPDLVVAHSGFGSSLFLPHLYDAPIVNFFEYYYRATGGAFSFRPEFPVGEGDVLRAGPNNAMILLDLQTCDRGWCPNYAQRDVMPGEYHGKIEVIPEGVDTHLYRRREWGNAECRMLNDECRMAPHPGPLPWVPLDCARGRQGRGRKLPDGTVIPDGARVVTYVARGFELMRGFDVFMAAAKRIYEMCPDVVFVVVGTDRAHYMPDRKLTGGKTLRRRVLETGDFDLSRFHFTGWLPEDRLVDVLSISDLHVYLTAPFITSWSMLDAMSCACVVLASDQGCTREYVEHGRNGLLCDFFDAEGIARQAVGVLRDVEGHRALGEAARRTIEEKYSLDVALPRLKAMFEDVAAKGPRTPSVRAEGLVRAGAKAAWMAAPRACAGAEVGVGLRPFGGAVPFSIGGSSATDTQEIGPSPLPSPLGTARLSSPQAGERGYGPSTPGASGKTVLFAWELGGGMGHLAQMLPLARDLAAAGHCVVVALRHLERAADVLGPAGVFYLQAPYRSPLGRPVRPAATFADMLTSLGWGADGELFALASAWRNLIRSVGPDLIVCDHSPTALLAARDFPDVRRAVIGSGFCVPPDNEPDGAARRPWGVLRPGMVAADAARVLAVEAEVLDRVNWVLEGWGRPPVARLGQLYSEADETFLTTLPELDPFRDRAGAAYWGPVGAGGNAECGMMNAEWPLTPALSPEYRGEGERARVFAYLKNTASAAAVLRGLEAEGCLTLAYVEGLGETARKRLASRTLRVADRPVDVAAAARACDLAVVNGGHGVCAEMLLAGKPVLAVPIVLEQQMTGAALARLGAGSVAVPVRGAAWEQWGGAVVRDMLTSRTYGDAAVRFAERYRAFDPTQQRRAMFGRATALLAAGEPLREEPARVAAVA